MLQNAVNQLEEATDERRASHGGRHHGHDDEDPEHDDGDHDDEVDTTDTMMRVTRVVILVITVPAVVTVPTKVTATTVVALGLAVVTMALVVAVGVQAVEARPREEMTMDELIEFRSRRVARRNSSVLSILWLLLGG